MFQVAFNRKVLVFSVPVNVEVVLLPVSADASVATYDDVAQVNSPPMLNLLLRLYPTPNPNPRLESVSPPDPCPVSKDFPWVYCGCSVNSHLPPRDGTLCAPAAAAYKAASTSAVMRSTDFIESSLSFRIRIPSSDRGRNSPPYLPRTRGSLRYQPSA